MALEPQLEGNSSSPVGDQLQNSVNKAEQFTLLNGLDMNVNFNLLRTVCSVLGRISSPAGDEDASFVPLQGWCRGLWMPLTLYVLERELGSVGAHSAHSGGRIMDALGVLQRR